MKLWIRSQDRRILIKPDRIDIDDNLIVVWQNNYNCDEIYLGTYATKERALEVLDEIQSILGTNKLFELYSNIGAFPDDFNKKYNYVEVYKMPKK